MIEQQDDTKVELVWQSGSEESEEDPDSKEGEQTLRQAHDVSLKKQTPWKSTESTWYPTRDNLRSSLLT